MKAADHQSGGAGNYAEWPARKPVLPTINAEATGPRSRWSTGNEQYLDSHEAGIIEPHPGQDQTLPLGTLRHSAQSTKMPGIERMAPGLVRVTFPARVSNAAEPESSNRAQSRQGGMLYSGLAARAWEEGPLLAVLGPYCPASWHHPQGIHKILRKLLPRLPDVSGSLFFTLTYDRMLFEGPESAFGKGRDRIRRMMCRLREGASWKGKLYQIDAPYCVKLEFHADEDGWPHFHLVVLTRHYVPADLLMHLWSYGFCKVRRINNHKFHYLLKYVTKSGGGYPAWALNRNRLRIFQPSRRFMRPEDTPEQPAEKTVALARPKRKRASYTIGERQNRWERMGLLRQGVKFITLLLSAPFQRLLGKHVLSIAEDKRYLGNGFIKINHRKELFPWILNPSMVSNLVFT